MTRTFPTQPATPPESHPHRPCGTAKLSLTQSQPQSHSRPLSRGGSQPRQIIAGYWVVFPFGDVASEWTTRTARLRGRTISNSSATWCSTPLTLTTSVVQPSGRSACASSVTFSRFPFASSSVHGRLPNGKLRPDLRADVHEDLRSRRDTSFSSGPGRWLNRSPMTEYQPSSMPLAAR
jgi:hypothetical protein